MNKMVLSGVFIYMAGMLAVGYWSSKKIKNLTDFLVAGRRLPFYLAVATLFATWFGAGSCMGASGTAYSKGLLGVISDFSEPIFYSAAAYGGLVSFLSYVAATSVRYKKIKPIKLASEYPKK